MQVPLSLLEYPLGCSCPSHCSLIDDYYNVLVKSLNIASSHCVPKTPVNSLKPFWDSNLNSLKEYSIDMHNLWRQCGCPKQGVINSARLKAKYDYKIAIRQAADKYDQLNADEISAFFLLQRLYKFLEILE